MISKYIEYHGKRYALDYNKLKEICLSSSTEKGTSEIEISQAYEVNDAGQLEIASKVEHETKTDSIPQNDMIIYDLVKILLMSLLDNATTQSFDNMDIGSAITINTLLYWGILVEVI